MPLDKDNAGHRNLSDQLDAKFGGKSFYDKVERPIIHGAYHAGRYVRSSNPEEWARAKDQFGKFGTGQSQTEYLQKHREQVQREQKERQETQKRIEQFVPELMRQQQNFQLPTQQPQMFPQPMQQQWLQPQQQLPQKSFFEIFRKN